MDRNHQMNRDELRARRREQIAASVERAVARLVAETGRAATAADVARIRKRAKKKQKKRAAAWRARHNPTFELLRAAYIRERIREARGLTWMRYLYPHYTAELASQAKYANGRRSPRRNSWA